MRVKRYLMKEGRLFSTFMQDDDPRMETTFEHPPPEWDPPEQWELDSMEETKEREREDGQHQPNYSLRQRNNHYWEGRRR